MPLNSPTPMSAMRMHPLRFGCFMSAHCDVVWVSPTRLSVARSGGHQKSGTLADLDPPTLTQRFFLGRQILDGNPTAGQIGDVTENAGAVARASDKIQHSTSIHAGTPPGEEIVALKTYFQVGLGLVVGLAQFRAWSLSRRLRTSHAAVIVHAPPSAWKHSTKGVNIPPCAFRSATALPSHAPAPDSRLQRPRSGNFRSSIARAPGR